MLARAAGVRAALTLLLLLVTTATAWATNRLVAKSQNPIGNLDVVETYAGCVHVVGWTCDPYQFVIEENEHGLNPYAFINDITRFYVLNDSWLDNFTWKLSQNQDIFYTARQNQVEIHSFTRF